MTRNRVCSLLAAVLLLTPACGTEVDAPASYDCTLREDIGSTCSDGKDNDCDGLTDLEDPDCSNPCFPSCCPKICHQQTDCAEVGGMYAWSETSLCVEEHCISPAPISGCCGKPVENKLLALVSIDSTMQSAPQDMKPKSLLIRIIASRKSDGRVFKRFWGSCEQLLPRFGKTPETRSMAEQDPDINQTYRMLFVADWPASTSSLDFDLNVPANYDSFMVAELWYGATESGDMQPTGNRASVTCTPLSPDQNGRVKLPFSSYQN